MEKARPEEDIIEEGLREVLKTKNEKLATVVSEIRSIDACLHHNLNAVGAVDAANQYLLLLDKAEAIGNADITNGIKGQRFRESFLAEKGNPRAASIHSSNLKELLTRVRSQLMDERDSLGGTIIPALEERLHRLKVDRLTLDFGEESVTLTRRNIKVSFWVPVVVLAIILFGLVVYNSFKPEISDFIRQIFGLTSLGSL